MNYQEIKRGQEPKLNHQHVVFKAEDEDHIKTYAKWANIVVTVLFALVAISYGINALSSFVFSPLTFIVSGVYIYFMYQFYVNVKSLTKNIGGLDFLTHSNVVSLNKISLFMVLHNLFDGFVSPVSSGWKLVHLYTSKGTVVGYSIDSLVVLIVALLIKVIAQVLQKTIELKEEYELTI